MSLNKRIYFGTIDATDEQLYLNVVGTVTKITSITLSQPSTGLATTIRLTIGADAAATRWFEYPVPAGAGFYTFYPGLVLSGTESIRGHSVSADDVVVCTINAIQDLVA